MLSIPTRQVFDETQETLRTSAFPSSHVQARRRPPGAPALPECTFYFTSWYSCSGQDS